MNQTLIDTDALWNKLLSEDEPITMDERRALRRILLATKVASHQAAEIPADNYARQAGTLDAILVTYKAEFTTGGTK